MNQKKVKKLRREYKKTLDFVITDSEIVEKGTVIAKSNIFNKHDWRLYKREKS